MSFSFSAKRNRIVPPARDIKLLAKVVTNSKAIPKCVFVNNNDTKILEENNYIVRRIEQPSSIYFRCLDKTPSQRSAKFTALLIEKLPILKISYLTGTMALLSYLVTNLRK